MLQLVDQVGISQFRGWWSSLSRAFAELLDEPEVRIGSGQPSNDLGDLHLGWQLKILFLGDDLGQQIRRRVLESLLVK